MKRLLLLFATVLGGVISSSAEIKLSAGEPTNNAGDGAYYNSTTKVITFNEQWGWRPGWWIGDKDYSSYESFVVEFSGTVSNKVQVLVEYTDTYTEGEKEYRYASYGNNGDEHANTITVTLDADHKNSIRQIYFQLIDALGDGEKATVTFKDAYFYTSADRATLAFDLKTMTSKWKEADTFDPNTYLATIQDGGGIGWWSGTNVSLYNSAVMIFEPSIWGGKLYAGGTSVDFSGGATYAIVDLSSVDGELENFVVQDWKHDPWRLKAAYLSTLDATDEEAYITSHDWPLIMGAGYCTFVPTRKIDFTGSGVQAFIATAVSETITLTEATVVPANTPIVLKGSEGCYDLATSEEAADDVSKNLLQVSDGSVTGGANIYVLANKTAGVGFYPTSGSITIPAGKCYLNTGTGASEFLGFDFEEGNTTAIDATLKGNGKTTDNVVYNLNGQRVAQPAKGLYIVNGKKVVIK